MAAYIYHLSHQQDRQRRPLVFRERTNPLGFLSDTELHERYRFPRRGIEEIIEMVKLDVSPHTQRSHALNATTKVSISVSKMYG